MGNLESASDEPRLRETHRTQHFVLRGGRYEPQSHILAPIVDAVEFNGFPARAQGRFPFRRGVPPPEMRHEALHKNPISVRRESVHVETVEGQQHQALCFTFDALAPGKLSVHIAVKELEHVDQDPELINRATRNIEIAHPPGALQLDPYTFAAGMGQQYRSPPVDLGSVPPSRLSFSASRRRHLPVAVIMEPEPVPGGAPGVHFTYITFSGGTTGRDTGAYATAKPVTGVLAADTADAIDSTADDESLLDMAEWEDPMLLGGHDAWETTPVAEGQAEDRQQQQQQQQPWSAQVFAQKLQFGGQTFVLHDVFGVNSKFADPDSASQECIICLTEPRDTAVLPCRHLCVCSQCAGVLRHRCERCPICRTKVKSLLTFTHGHDPLLGEPLESQANAQGSDFFACPGPQPAAKSPDAPGAAGPAGAADILGLQGAGRQYSAACSSSAVDILATRAAGGDP